MSDDRGSTALVSWVTILIVLVSVIYITLLVSGALGPVDLGAAFDDRGRWCARSCGAQRVLVCQDVTDPAWSKPRRAVLCVVDSQAFEVRSVIDDGGTP